MCSISLCPIAWYLLSLSFVLLSYYHFCDLVIAAVWQAQLHLQG